MDIADIGYCNAVTLLFPVATVTAVEKDRNQSLRSHFLL